MAWPPSMPMRIAILPSFFACRMPATESVKTRSFGWESTIRWIRSMNSRAFLAEPPDFAKSAFTYAARNGAVTPPSRQRGMSMWPTVLRTARSFQRFSSSSGTSSWVSTTIALFWSRIARS